MRFAWALVFLLALVISQVSSTKIVANDVAALTALFNSLGGSNWVTKWDLTTVNTTFCKTYEGSVTCALDGTVHAVNLNNNNLVGTLPTQIGLFTKLSSFQASGNSITGSIPTQISAITSLGVLALSNNQIGGSLPTQIGLLTNLGGLTINNNLFTGSFPSEIALLPKATFFNCYVNQFISLPTQFGPKVTSIRFENNHLTGQLPGSIFLNSPLKEFRVSTNQITGTIPTEVAVPPLVDLYLWSNNLTGPLPTQLGNSGLSRLWVYTNQLSGSIPTEYGKSSSLIDLRLMGNQLSGSIPTQLSTAPLQVLWLSSNQFSGTIPSFLFSMASLGSIKLNSNPFTGLLPTALQTDSVLTALSLSGTCVSPVSDYSSVLTNDYSSFVVGSNCAAYANPVFSTNLPGTTILQYEFNSAQPLVDSSSNGISLSQRDSSITVYTVAVGQIGNPINTALVIPSTTTFAFRTSSRISFPTAISVEVIFALSSLGSSNQDIFSFSTSVTPSSYASIVSVKSNGALLLALGSSSNTISSLTVTTGVLHHLIVTSSGSSIILYLDGVQMAETAISATLSGSYYMNIARNTRILVDEFYVYNSALSMSAVSARHSELEWCPAGSCPVPKTCSTLIMGDTCS